MNILGFIPARAGSKRVGNKNIKLLGGKPLIAYTIEAALHSQSIHRVVVSTDSPDIASTACQFGAEVPFLRPENISQSDSTEMQFFEHALTWFKTHENYVPDLIVLLYPTAPFRKPSTIERAIQEIRQHPEADSLRSIRPCKEHPYKMWQINNNLLEPFVKNMDKNIHTLSYQVLPPVYIQNANIYITKPTTLLTKKSPTGDIILPFVMDELESVDINTELDFQIAEILLQTRVNTKNT